jgi:hypothetical protein
MAKRRWQVEWRTQARSDGLDRLGLMVKLVIDHAAVPPGVQPKKDGRPPGHRDHDGDRNGKETLP